MSQDAGSYGATLTLDDSQFVEGMDNADQRMDEFVNGVEGGTSQASKKMSIFGAGLGTIAAGAIAGLGVALAGAGIAGVKMADDLQGSLNSLQMSTGATDEEMKGMGDSLKNIYNANYGESFEDIAESMATVKQNTGLAGDALEEATKDALLLRDAFGKDVSESTNTANSLMKKFGISSEEAFNLMAQGIQNGADKNGDFLESLNEYAEHFSSLGMDATEFTNVLIDGAKKGSFSIDKVADSVKEFSVKSKDGSKTSAEGFQLLGLNAEEMTQKFAEGGKTGKKAFKEVMDALNSMEDPYEKNAAGVALFGTMFEDLGAKGVEALGEIGNTASLSKDALGEMEKVRFNTIGDALQGIWRNMQTALITPIQEHVLPLLNSFFNVIQSNMPAIQSTISTVFSAVGGVLGTFIGKVKSIASAFQGTSSSTSSTFNAIKNTVMSFMTTIGSIIQSVIGVVMVLWNNFGSTLVTYATNTFQNLMTIIGGALTVIKGVVSTVLAVLTGDWKGAWEGIKNIVSGLLTIIGGIISQALNVINMVVTVGLTALKGVFSGIWNGIKSLVSVVVTGIITYITTNFQRSSALLHTILTGISSFFSTIWSGIKSFVVSVASGIYSALQSKFNLAKATLSAILSGISSVFSSIWNSIKSTVVNVASGIYTSVQSKFNSMKSTVSNIFGGILSKAKEIFGKIKSAITSPIETAVTTVKDLIQKIKDAFSDLKLKIPKPSIPKIDITTGTKKIAGANVKYPKISWHKNGGFFDKASVVGLGEAGREAILPLENKRYMAPFADAVYSRLRDNLATSKVNNTKTTNTKQNVFNINNTNHFDIKHKLDNAEIARVSKVMYSEIERGVKVLGGSI